MHLFLNFAINSVYAQLLSGGVMGCCAKAALAGQRFGLAACSGYLLDIKKVKRKNELHTYHAALFNLLCHIEQYDRK